MATSADDGKALVKESYGDLLTCTICLETFKVPKYLPCLHTFCETCIHTYIVSSVKEDSPETFKCPICRRQVQIQECQGKADSWAQQLPGNHFIVSLIDRRELKQDEKQCAACGSNNKSTKAVSWCIVCEEAYCDACETSHKSFKATRGHKIVQIKDMREDKAVSLSGFVKGNEHPQKTIEVYCIDHSKPCCTLCATVHHRKCEQVVTIDKVLSNIKESEKVRNLFKRLKEGNENLDEILQKREQNIKSFETDTDTILSKIWTLKENLIKHVDRLEERLRNEISNSKKQVTIKMNDEVTELSSLKSTFINWKQIFDACIAEGSELHCLVRMEEILEKLPQVDKQVSKLTTEMEETTLSFDPNDLISDITSLGSIIVKGSTMKLQKGMRKVNFHSGKVKLLLLIALPDHGDRVSGVFNHDCILLSNFINGKIVKYDNKGAQIGELNMSKKTSDLTNVYNWTVAVATKSTQIYLINAQTLTLQKSITANVTIYGINCIDNEYMSTDPDNFNISWLDSTFKSIKTEKLGTSVYFAYFNGKNDYVYNDSNYSVKRVSSTDTFTYRSEANPFTYGVDFEANIYVAGFTSDAIHQLTPTCKLVRIIPFSTFAVKPGTHVWVLRFEENSNRFLLTGFNSGKVLICQID